MKTIAILPALALAAALCAPAIAQTTGTTTTPTAPATAPSNMARPAPGAPAVSGPSSATNNAVNTAPPNNPGAPVPGANSFTEGQARDRIQDKGFTQVTDLKLDSQGIWRGKAMRNGVSVDVSLDYQGNVVPQ